MKVVVLGAGVIGVCSAWYLAQAGHEVVVVERQSAAGLETSFANGGQISVCHAEPWANPATPWKVLRWLGHESSPLLWRMRLDPAQWAWGLRFLRECRSSRARANIEALVALGLYSRSALQALRQELDLHYDQQQGGILHVYTDPREFEHAIPQAQLMTRLGCLRWVKSAGECAAIEPALAQARQPLVGGTFTPDDESGDAHQFTQRLAEACRQRGVRFEYGVDVSGIEAPYGVFNGIRCADGSRFSADACVVALGSYSGPALRPLGINVPVYPAKGYSITIPLAADTVAPQISITDDGHKLVFSRLGNRLRVAGTAEFCGYDTSLNRQRLDALRRRTAILFPQVRAAGTVAEWCGLRPATPGNVPLIGLSPVRNLFLNTGHGTLGWTLACGSGRLLADLVGGRVPDLSALPYAL